MKKIFTTFLCAIAALVPAHSELRYAGGDISLLPEYENANARYLDSNGSPISSALDYFKDEQLNIMRVRLFVNPKLYNGSDKDPNACQDFDYILPLCKRIVDAGFALMLDFHYSDTWADPEKQWTPAEWADLSDEQLYDKIYEYTKGVLEDLKAQGVVPTYIQTGNEISYGMLWGPVGTPASQLKKTFMGHDANWNRLQNLLSQASKACREICPDAKIVLHTERVAQPNVAVNFYDKMKDIDYDVIGISYYPYWHGNLSTLNTALTTLQNKYPEKEIQIVETGYPYKWEVPGATFDYTSTYPYSDKGQADFTRDLVEMCSGYTNVTAIVWWWMEYNAYGTSLQGWYNAPLFDSTTGRVCSALFELAKFNATSNIEKVYDEAGKSTNDMWFDLMGRRVDKPSVPGIYIHNHCKVIVK